MHTGTGGSTAGQHQPVTSAECGVLYVKCIRGARVDTGQHDILSGRQLNITRLCAIKEEGRALATRKFRGQRDIALCRQSVIRASDFSIHHIRAACHAGGEINVAGSIYRHLIKEKRQVLRISPGLL